MIKVLALYRAIFCSVTLQCTDCELWPPFEMATISCLRFYPQLPVASPQHQQPLEFLFAVNKYKSSCFVQFLLNTRLMCAAPSALFCVCMGCLGDGAATRGGAHDVFHKLITTTKILHQDPPPRS